MRVVPEGHWVDVITQLPLTSDVPDGQVTVGVVYPGFVVVYTVDP
jgi:hypothetical protein